LEKRSGAKSWLCHGFDESKFNAASLFHLPSQAKDPKDSFFRDYSEDDPKRGPLDVHQWVEKCILGLRPEPERVRAAPEPEAPKKPLTIFDTVDVDEVVEVQGLVDDGVVADRPEGRHRLEKVRQELLAKEAERLARRQDEKVAKAVEAWRSTSSGMGHTAFFKLGAALRGAGLDEFEIRAKLYEEASYARSPKERRGEIKGIVKKVSRSGTFDRRAA
jgi:hypothetical protein